MALPGVLDDGGDPRSPLRRVPPLHTAADAAVAADPEIAGMCETDLVEAVNRLRAQRDAVILAHNYQIPAIQDLADFVGDSLQLAQQASATDASLIVFCGVHFMAETAALICPDKRVLIPDPAAGCSLAESVTADDVRRWRSEHPNGIVVAYVNTDAAVKAEVDVCCTSTNAVQVVAALPPDREVLFLPDQFLGLYVQRIIGRQLQLWLGECHVHAAIRAEDVNAMLARYPDADLLLHPECGCVSTCLWALAEGELPAERTHVLSTGGMVRHAHECPASVDLIGTEIGLLHRLRQENPTKKFVPLRRDAICSYMKAITLPKLYLSLRDDVHPVTVPAEIAVRARAAIDRMLATV
jgi:quinolinate synthase